MFRKSFAVLALTLCATAFAMPKPSEVNAAFAAHDYPRAESMLKEVLAAKDSPKAHWQLGQVYSAEGKHQQALAEMKQAAKMDPTFKFASTAAAGVRIMSNEQALAAPPAVVVQSPIAIPQGYAVVAQAAPTPAPVQADSGHGAGFFLFVLLLIGGLAAGAYFLFFGKKKEENDARAAKEQEASTKKAQLLDYSKDLEDATLIAKTSAIPEDERVLVLQQIAEIQKSVRQGIANLKDGSGISNSSVNKIGELVSQVSERAQHGIPKEDSKPTPMPPYAPPIPKDFGQAPENAQQVPSTYGRVDAIRPVPPAPTPTYVAPAPTQTVFHHHYPAPAPVVVNNGNDFTTGLILGEMMSQPRERVVERTVYVEERAPAPAPYYAPPAPYYAPPPAQLDTSDDDDNTYKSDPAPSLDSGGSDSWSSSSDSSSDSSSSDSGDSY